MSLLIFIWSCWAAPGVDGAAHIPPSISFAVAVAAVHHQVDATEAAAVLIAENRSRRFDPATVGRAGRGGERGLYQLAQHPWTREVMERCAPEHRREHHRYRSKGDCLALASRPPDFFDSAENIEAAMVVLAYLRAKQREDRPQLWDWLATYRCHPSAYTPWNRVSPACERSVNRVRAWEASIIEEQARARRWLLGFTSSSAGGEG